MTHLPDVLLALFLFCIVVLEGVSLAVMHRHMRRVEQQMREDEARWAAQLERALREVGES